jgi:segregation and condensation protein B
VRRFVKTPPPLKLSMAALETLSVIAYAAGDPAGNPGNTRRQCRGVIRTLLDHKLITTAGRKQALGRPILYKTTREFLLQFGLSDLSELPSLKEFEELSRAALEPAEPAPAGQAEAVAATPAPTAEEGALPKAEE